MPEQTPVLVETRNLCKYFTGRRSLLEARPQQVKAVDHVDLTIHRGETLGLVGESGCGKSTLGRTILNLTPATAGRVLYEGRELTAGGQRESWGRRRQHKKELWRQRQKMQIIFQDPYSSLNPRMTVYELVSAPLDVYHIGTPAQRREKVVEILREVGLGEQHLNRFPHEFSGGQRQRIGIARALVLEPEFVVCDEAVSALDVSVRAQVLNLMCGLQKKRGLTYLFISHDLSVVRHVSDRVAVMYLGNVVELADKAALYGCPVHPYTKALLSAIPLPNGGRDRKRIILQGDVPNIYDPPGGCKFHTRCPYATEQCKTQAPALAQIAPGHSVACHRAAEFFAQAGEK